MSELPRSPLTLEALRSAALRIIALVEAPKGVAEKDITYLVDMAAIVVVIKKIRHEDPNVQMLRRGFVFMTEKKRPLVPGESIP